ncbi:Thousand and one amino acid protein kinase [Fasciolopsis buskii]|uniref:non-specific serine/threonine protein kinase n=1 Tax=Fasciolopsis buskii TaxID=27845 RepID=A0A8E0RRP8_9TREM|nr:Thousand and one amino acid protein kinase [Fasciolopsis buski]
MCKEFQRPGEVHAIKMETERKRAAAAESKLVRQLETATTSELKTAKKSWGRSLSPRDPSELGSVRHHDPLKVVRRRRQDLTNLEIRKTKHASLLQIQAMENHQLTQYITLEQKANDKMSALLLDQHTKLEVLDLTQQKQVHKMRLVQLQKQHEAKMNNQHQYIERTKVDLLKKHVLETKNLPKHLKQRELQIRKQFRDADGIQKMQFKLLHEEGIKACSRSLELNKRQILDNLKLEGKRKQADLGAHYKKTISELHKRLNAKGDSYQLANYQENQRQKTLKPQQEARLELKNRIYSSKESLEAAITKNAESAKEEPRKKTRHLMKRHLDALRAFDAKICSLGIDNAAVIVTSGRVLGSGKGGSPGPISGSFTGSSGQRPSDWRHSRAEFPPAWVRFPGSQFIDPAPSCAQCAFRDKVLQWTSPRD